MPELRRRVGMVFQTPALFDGTVLDNVAYGPRLWGRVGRSKSGVGSSGIWSRGARPSDASAGR